MQMMASFQPVDEETVDVRHVALTLAQTHKSIIAPQLFCSHTVSSPGLAGQHLMGRGLAHLKVPIQRVPGLSVELARSLPF